MLDKLTALLKKNGYQKINDNYFNGVDTVTFLEPNSPDCVRITKGDPLGMGLDEELEERGLI